MDNKSIQEKIDAKKKEAQDFLTKSQAELSSMQQQLQEKVRFTQQTIDNYKGQIDALTEVLASLNTETKPEQEQAKE